MLKPHLLPQSPSADRLSLRSVFLHVTKACNLACSYCYFSARRRMPDELTTEELRHVIRQIIMISPRKVVLTGGEPLVRPDLFEVLEELKTAGPKHGIKRSLNTNGHLVTESVARALVPLVDEVRVSLDALASRNDGLRGEGNFAAALNALDLFRSAGFEPKVLVTVTSESLPDLEELIVLLRRRQMTRIKVNLFRTIGRGSGQPQLQVDPNSVAAAIRRAQERCRPGSVSSASSRIREPQPNCGVGQFLNISPNGDVFPCHVLTSSKFRCGNLRNESLLQICSRKGLLGRLAELDLRSDIPSGDLQRIGMHRSDACLGEAYSETSTNSVWQDLLPMLTTLPERDSEQGTCHE